MLLMDRIEIYPTGKTMVSKTTCEKEGEGKLERTELVNPMLSCCKEDTCSQYNVSAKGFFSLYKEKMETRILDGAMSLIFEVSDCKDISLKPSDPPVRNEANTEAEGAPQVPSQLQGGVQQGPQGVPRRLLCQEHQADGGCCCEDLLCGNRGAAKVVYYLYASVLCGINCRPT